MAAASTITINDGTPTAHNFVPARKSGDKVVWEERTTASTPRGFYTITINQSKTNGPVIRSKISLAMPVEVQDTDTGLYSYADVCRFNIDVLIPVNSTATVRADTYAYLKNLMADSVIDSLIADIDPPY